ncbi:MAG: metal-dependent hydrolase [archaeon]
MLLKTHIAANILFALIFSGQFSNKIAFVSIVILATMLPDIDTLHSFIGRKYRIFAKIAFFLSKHRGFFHSFTCSFILSAILFAFSPFVSMAFFAGYSMHILLDSFTVQGVEPFWPVKYKVKGRITTGGITEKIIFSVLVLLDIAWIAAYLF